MSDRFRNDDIREFERDSHIKDFFRRLGENRVIILFLLMCVFSMILIGRLFFLQIVKGEYYQSNYNLRIVKTESIPAARGNIYDRNGNLLAENTLAYAVTIRDSGSYETTKERNEKLNAEIAAIIENLAKNGDHIDNDFDIRINAAGDYEFTVEGTALQRFRADIYDKTYVTELKYDRDLGYNTAEASADQIMEYLTNDRYAISDTLYDKNMQYQIAIVRFGMSLNAYQKYLATTIASNVSESSVAYIEENKNDLIGVDVEESTVRKYIDGEAFAGIIGYTGTISSEEYEERVEEDESVERSDKVGKAGIEKFMDEYLSGKKGYQTLYVDNLGNPLEVTDYTEPESGSDLYLSLDKDLQTATYNLLEREVAGILYTKIVNLREVGETESEDDIVIPIFDVYHALINNGLVDFRHFSNTDATDLEKTVQSAYDNHAANVSTTLLSYLTAETPTPYNLLPEEYQDIMSYIVKSLKSSGIFDAEKIDATDDVQKQWTSESLPVNDYLKYAIEQDWIDFTRFTEQNQYVDTTEIYNNLVFYILGNITQESGYVKLLYKYCLLNDEVTGAQLCAILYDQGVLDYDEGTRNGLLNGTVWSYDFLKNKINTLEITPAELALDPCSASSVVIDTKTGDVLACVSYPGYDNNRLANPSDSSYYTYLNSSLSNPLYNHATQQRTAPGSTFKIVMSTAGMAEGVITPLSEIVDKGEFELVSNKPKCWYYPHSHGSINVSQAIQYSCNYFFYQVGFDLAGGANYSDAGGIAKIQKYASMFGLDRKTGVEMEEVTPTVATEYPVMAAIGQSNNNYTTVSLARYCTAVASSGDVYTLSILDHVSDADGNVLETFGSQPESHVDVLDLYEWNAIHSGMRMVVEDLSTFNNFPIEVAGKTGTAQESAVRPNHALFIGYAPYSAPEIAIATRIPYGYTSHNAADISKHILGVYFDVEDSKKLANTTVATDTISGTSTNTVND